MKTSVAIIIGSVIIAISVLFSGWYERNLAYNMCVRLFEENPFNRTKYDNPIFIKKYCEFNVIVKKGTDPDFKLQFTEAK